MSRDSDSDKEDVEDVEEEEQEQAKIKLKRNTEIPRDVYGWFEITLRDIDVPSQQFNASTEIHVFWQDFNLPNVFPNYEEDDFEVDDDYVPIKMSEIFENKVEISNSDPVFKYYPETGTVYMMFVVECTFVERMELQRFPLDRQFMNMEFNAWVKQGNWNWVLDYTELDWVPEEFRKASCVRMLSSITEYELLDPWLDFSGDQPLHIRLRVNRLPSYYFGNIIFPNFLIVAGAFSAFVISPDDVADRLSVTVTLMLAAVAFRFVVSTMLPKVSYLTFMDYYLLTGFIALIVIITENAINGIEGLGSNAREYVDDVCMAAFGTLWLVIHVIALYALLDKECLRVSWQKMDEIDKAEDEEDEFVFAKPDKTQGKTESKECQQDWENFKQYTDPLERAQEYAKKHGIKRTATFNVPAMGKPKSNKVRKNTRKKSEQFKKKTIDAIHEVPAKVPKTNNLEQKMINSINLGNEKKEEQKEEEKKDENIEQNENNQNNESNQQELQDLWNENQNKNENENQSENVSSDYVKVDEQNNEE